jgi:hypothetical protein
VDQAANCTSIYLDTVEGMKKRAGLELSDREHHQGLARTHKHRDGSVTFFLSHAEFDGGNKGSLSVYQYRGPTQDEHVLDTSPYTIAPMKQNVLIEERHPSDIVFLPEVNGLEAGYLFVTEEQVMRRLAVYRWDPAQGLVLHGYLRQGFPAIHTDGGGRATGGPNLLFLDRVGHDYYLGVASNNWGWGKLFIARDRELFPGCRPGGLDIDAFQPAPDGLFPFPVTGSAIAGGASQNKLVRDATGQWYLLGFRSEPDDDEHGEDHIDVYEVTFAPFRISYCLRSFHVAFRSGDTGFASTGTHHVEPSGRLLVSSSYRWAEDEGPGSSGYVSRVDEIPSF